MTKNIDLTSVPVVSGKSVLKTMVAIFKEEAEVPRVLAESETFIAYTLKNRRAIRLICRANNERGSFRLHTAPVHTLRFVSFHSNVAASASDSDFYVWLVVAQGDEAEKDGAGAAVSAAAAAGGSCLTVKPYFKLVDNVIIRNFHFYLNAMNGMPDLLLMYGKSVAVLESSKLISEYDNVMLEARLSATSREIRALQHETSNKSLCSSFRGGWLAFTSEPTKVMACTQRNTSTPAWSGCDGEEILRMSFVAPLPSGSAVTDLSALLALSSTTAVYLWHLSGHSEPALLRTFSFGSLVTMLASRNAIAIFNSSGQVARVEVRDTTGNCEATVYDMGATVRPTSVCFNQASRFSTILVDAQKEMDLYQLASRPLAGNGPATGAEDSSTQLPATDLHHQQQQQSIASHATAAVAPVTTAATPFVDPCIISSSLSPASLTRQRDNITAAVVAATAAAKSSPPPVATTSAAAINNNPVAAAAAYQAARNALQNAALPQALDGIVASATYMGDESVRRGVEGLVNVIKNIEQILELTPDQVMRDHRQLLSVALEAQMTELQSSNPAITAAAPAVAAAPAHQPVSRQHATAFNSFTMASMLAPIANEIANGVTRGIRDTLRTELDTAVHAAFGANIHSAQKEVLRRRLDEVLQSSVKVFSEEANKRVEDFIQREFAEALAKTNNYLSTLEEQNRKLQAAINSIVDSGVVKEVDDMRKELAAMRHALATGGVLQTTEAKSSEEAAVSALSPQTVIETAEKYIKEGEVDKGISYVLLAQNPRCTAQLIARLPEECVSNIVSESAISDTMWIKALSQLTEMSATETEKEVEAVSSFIFDAISEHDRVISLKTAKSQKLRSDIRHFVAFARDRVVSSEGKRILKGLEKSIQ